MHPNEPQVVFLSHDTKEFYIDSPDADVIVQAGRHTARHHHALEVQAERQVQELFTPEQIATDRLLRTRRQQAAARVR